MFQKTLQTILSVTQPRTQRSASIRSSNPNPRSRRSRRGNQAQPQDQHRHRRDRLQHQNVGADGAAQGDALASSPSRRPSKASSCRCQSAFRSLAPPDLQSLRCLLPTSRATCHFGFARLTLQRSEIAATFDAGCSPSSSLSATRRCRST